MVDIDVEGDIFSSIVIETPASAPYLTLNNVVGLVFKETEVSIAKDLTGLISLRNRFKATVSSIEVSQLLTKVFLNYKNRSIVSIIATRSAQKLGLSPGDEIEWLVKTNEVSLIKEG